jgi:SAM-dependent methyltransferase
VSANQQWLETAWSTVRPHLPAAPAVVVELGCGAVGGLVPALLDDGYQAIGIDPEAPEGASYRQVEFEHCELPSEVDAVVASVSLHHVSDPAEVLDRIAGALKPDGTIVVIEWDWESFDEASARWAFDRLDLAGEPKGWLHRGREHWLASGLPWDTYLREWASGHGLHSARALVGGLDERFERVSCARGAYLFPELAGTSEADELEAIDAGLIRALRIDYVGRLNPFGARPT